LDDRPSDSHSTALGDESSVARNYFTQLMSFREAAKISRRNACPLTLSMQMASSAKVSCEKNKFWIIDPGHDLQISSYKPLTSYNPLSKVFFKNIPVFDGQKPPMNDPDGQILRDFPHCSGGLSQQVLFDIKSAITQVKSKEAKASKAEDERR
jgi:hypothetical protein